MEPDPPPFRNPPGVPPLTALAILITLSLLGLIVLGSLWLTRYVPVHTDFGQDATITDADDARYIIPILFGGLTLIALMWVVTWLRARWTVTTFPVAMAVIAGLALIAALYGLWQSRTGGHEIVIQTYICENLQDRPAPFNDSLPDGCEIAPDAQAVTIGTADNPDLFQPDSSAESPGRFTDLPPGTYRAQLTTPSRPETASVILAAETDEGIRALRPLQHRDGETWSGSMTLHPDLDTYYVLLNASSYSPAPEASVTFTVQECRGVSLVTFNPAACEPETFDRPIIEEVPSPDDAPGRRLSLSIDDGSMTLTNLEARTYTLTPTIALASMTTFSPTILVIPADEPQIRENSILQPGEAVFGTFTVEVGEESGPLEYTIYIFEERQTVARSVEPLFDMRP